MTRTYALIPVKELDKAKERLAPVLGAEARRELARAMFRDVLGAALACPDGVAVATRDAAVLALAAEAGAEGLDEPGGLNEALTSAAEKIAARGGERLLVLAADLPLASAEAIEQVARAGADVAVVPSRDGGTNALLLSPGAIAFQFGPDSAARHLAAAQQAGLSSLRLDLPSLALDIDTPDDLELLRTGFDRLNHRAEGSLTIGQHTLAALRRIGLSSPARKRA